MTQNRQKDIFSSVVVPIMEKVRDDLNRNRAEEYKRHAGSVGALMASAAGPDGGMSATHAYNDTIYYTGQWNTKTVEDYVALVQAELRKRGIEIDAVMEKKMVDYLIHQRMPKSTVEYIMNKSAEGFLFAIPQRMRSSSLDHHISKEAEKRYDPSFLSEITANVVSWISNAAATAGVGGLIGQTAIDGATAAADKVANGQQDKYLAKQREQGRREVAYAEKKHVNVPKWMLDQMGFDSVDNATDKQLIMAKDWATKQARLYRNKVNAALENGSRTVKASGKNTEISVSTATVKAKEYETFVKAIADEQQSRKSAHRAQDVNYFDIVGTDANSQTTYSYASSEQPEQNTGMQATSQSQQKDNYAGWDSIIQMLGLNGTGDTFNHLGYSLAMLPDMLLGIMTGKTKSVGMNKDTLMPLASILCGSFVSNPLLKISLMGYGGLNLFNRMSQEGLAEKRKEDEPATIRYKKYADEQLDSRISNPHIEGNVLIVDFDHVPRIITLPQQIIDGYRSGALPLNTIANRVLVKADQMAETEKSIQHASEKYEQNQQQTVTRSLAQR
jgi:hypothetical protein